MLRQVGPDEAGLLAAIHGASFPPQDAWGADALRLMLEMPGAFGLLAAEAGFILARVAADEAEILTLAVHPAARRQGLALALLETTAMAAAARGAAALFLEVSAGNAAAQALYAAAGFAEVGRRKRYYPDGSDALVLRLDLAAA
ncbi:ribosomal-protein-alanine N-acetyltransferase [Pseudoroseomonas deserti]|uniref:[Ribosomal protein bS18]-alanine N-acetyltransferase n=1 Tax=Teichococcus deserti TaxID=1817963 RepID=A0A1V2H118_9PROT|nr:ribosomal protein S18-alanine N-acetyltransferase [Pseudoroseomonas deserti]ONG52734.1 ribosomal-protein-alanine N-acetyltransferase [Pseudoroseomonas deserti]